MAYSFPKNENTDKPVCKCKSGRYKENDPFNLTRWFQVVSHCKIHWPKMVWQQKINIMKLENVLGDFE